MRKETGGKERKKRKEEHADKEEHMEKISDMDVNGEAIVDTATCWLVL